MALSIESSTRFRSERLRARQRDALEIARSQDPLRGIPGAHRRAARGPTAHGRLARGSATGGVRATGSEPHAQRRVHAARVHAARVHAARVHAAEVEAHLTAKRQRCRGSAGQTCSGQTARKAAGSGR
eukprot:7351828-Prymnesium_polylepis.1